MDGDSYKTEPILSRTRTSRRSSCLPMTSALKVFHFGVSRGGLKSKGCSGGMAGHGTSNPLHPYSRPRSHEKAACRPPEGAEGYSGDRADTHGASRNPGAYKSIPSRGI